GLRHLVGLEGHAAHLTPPRPEGAVVAVALAGGGHHRFEDGLLTLRRADMRDAGADVRRAPGDLRLVHEVQRCSTRLPLRLRAGTDRLEAVSVAHQGELLDWVRSAVDVHTLNYRNICSAGQWVGSTCRATLVRSGRRQPSDGILCSRITETF